MGPDTGWTEYFKRQVRIAQFLKREVGARPLRAYFITAFVSNLEGEDVLGFLRT